MAQQAAEPSLSVSWDSDWEPTEAGATRSGGNLAGCSCVLKLGNVVFSGGYKGSSLQVDHWKSDKGRQDKCLVQSHVPSALSYQRLWSLRWSEPCWIATAKFSETYKNISACWRKEGFFGIWNGDTWKKLEESGSTNPSSKNPLLQIHCQSKHSMLLIDQHVGGNTAGGWAHHSKRDQPQFTTTVPTCHRILRWIM